MEDWQRLLTVIGSVFIVEQAQLYMTGQTSYHHKRAQLLEVIAKYVKNQAKNPGSRTGALLDFCPTPSTAPSSASSSWVFIIVPALMLAGTVLFLFLNSAQEAQYDFSYSKMHLLSVLAWAEDMLDRLRLIIVITAYAVHDGFKQTEEVVLKQLEKFSESSQQSKMTEMEDQGSDPFVFSTGSDDFSESQLLQTSERRLLSISRLPRWAPQRTAWRLGRSADQDRHDASIPSKIPVRSIDTRAPVDEAPEAQQSTPRDDSQMHIENVFSQELDAATSNSEEKEEETIELPDDTTKSPMDIGQEDPGLAQLIQELESDTAARRSADACFNDAGPVPGVQDNSPAIAPFPVEYGKGSEADKPKSQVDRRSIPMPVRRHPKARSRRERETDTFLGGYRVVKTARSIQQSPIPCPSDCNACEPDQHGSNFSFSCPTADTETVEALLAAHGDTSHEDMARILEQWVDPETGRKLDMQPNESFSQLASGDEAVEPDFEIYRWIPGSQSGTTELEGAPKKLSFLRGEKVVRLPWSKPAEGTGSKPYDPALGQLSELARNLQASMIPDALEATPAYGSSGDWSH